MSANTGDDRSRIRVGHADTDEAIDILRQAVTEGRITIDELNERIDRVYAAKTFGDLDAVIADLPRPSAPVPSPQDDRDTLRLEASGGGSVTKSNYWLVPARIAVQSGWGTAKLDFTRADCPHREVSITVENTSAMGDVYIIVPRGWLVLTDDVKPLGWGGEVHNKPKERRDPDGVLIRVSGEVRGDLWVKYRRRPAS